MSNQDPYLTELVMLGELKEFEFETIEFEPGSGTRETDRLVLTLPSGKKIVIDTLCSGSSENACLIVDKHITVE